MQRKEEDMLVQKKMPDGEKEELSQVRMFFCLKWHYNILLAVIVIVCLSVCLQYRFCGVEL